MFDSASSFYPFIPPRSPFSYFLLLLFCSSYFPFFYLPVLFHYFLFQLFLLLLFFTPFIAPSPLPALVLSCLLQISDLFRSQTHLLPFSFPLLKYLPIAQVPSLSPVSITLALNPCIYFSPPTSFGNLP
jgi:hypothetical protein